jgi:(S)-ureidoglycine aminohydrolase
MRTPHEIVNSRARARQRYALFPIEGYPPSRIPGWPDCEARILASPALGAQFVEYLFDLPAGKGTGQGEAIEQVFGYVLSGAVRVMVSGDERSLDAGGFFFVPDDHEWWLKAIDPSKVILLRKRFESSEILARTGGPDFIIGHSSEVPAAPFAENPHTRLQLLMPDRIEYDFAMNIFTFDPGYGLPYVETHVMEHGLYFLEGKGMYYLDGEWMEVEKDDFIWMGPYCPQSFYATGPTPARYLYYKNVNREIPL